MTDERGTKAIGDVRTVCDIVDSALGPFGANKLIVRSDGTVTTTAAGSVALDRLEVTDPSATLLQSEIESFREARGDGASTLLTVLGGLLRETDRLLELGCHPSSIEAGYREAVNAADSYLETHARSLSTVDPEAVAETALTGTRDPALRSTVAELVVEAVDNVLAHAEGPNAVRRNVDVVCRVGSATDDTALVQGTVLDTDPVVESMPRTVDGGVAVLTGSVDVPHVSGLDWSGPAFTADAFDTREAIGERERAAFSKSLDAAVAAGCRAVFTTGGINERVVNQLASRGIVAFSTLDDDELARVARATGATVVPTLQEVTAATLGEAKVTIRRHAGRDMVRVVAEAEPVFTLFCRAPDPRSVADFERSVEAAVSATAAARSSDRAIPGGGAAEMGAARAVRDRARTVEGRAQLATNAFANALVTVPRALARNGGIDGWTAIARLGAAHASGRDAVGVDSMMGTTRDVLSPEPIADAVEVKSAAWNAATDLAIRFARIDEQLPASDLSDDDPEPATIE